MIIPKKHGFNIQWISEDSQCQKHIILPLTDEIIKELKAGDEVLLSGILYTGRDAAHERMAAILEKGGMP